MNTSDPYEISNQEFWYGLRGPEKMTEMKLKRDYFQVTHNKFYKLGGHWSEWQIWKGYLWKNNCEKFMVEDSDPVEKVMGGKWRKAWKPYGNDLSIAALNSLFVMVSDPADGISDEDDEDEESGEHLESGKSEGGALVATEDVEKEKMVDTVAAANT